MLIRLNVDQVRVLRLWGCDRDRADMGGGLTWVAGRHGSDPSNGRQLSLENSKINQIK